MNERYITEGTLARVTGYDPRSLARKLEDLAIVRDGLLVESAGEFNLYRVDRLPEIKAALERKDPLLELKRIPPAGSVFAFGPVTKVLP